MYLNVNRSSIGFYWVHVVYMKSNTESLSAENISKTQHLKCNPVWQSLPPTTTPKLISKTVICFFPYSSSTFSPSTLGRRFQTIIRLERKTFINHLNGNAFAFTPYSSPQFNNVRSESSLPTFFSASEKKSNAFIE